VVKLLLSFAAHTFSTVHFVNWVELQYTARCLFLHSYTPHSDLAGTRVGLDRRRRIVSRVRLIALHRRLYRGLALVSKEVAGDKTHVSLERVEHVCVLSGERHATGVAVLVPFADAAKRARAWGAGLSDSVNVVDGTVAALSINGSHTSLRSSINAEKRAQSGMWSRTNWLPSMRT